MKITRNEQIQNILIEQDRPMQRVEIYKELLKLTDKAITPGNMGVILNLVCKEGKLTKIKYKKTPGFYCLNDWIDPETKSLKEGYIFNPYSKTFKYP